MKKSSERTLRFHQKRRAAGLCIRCGKARVTNHYCAECHEKSKLCSRTRYRAKNGIPLDAEKNSYYRQRKSSRQLAAKNLSRSIRKIANALGDIANLLANAAA